MILKIFYLIFSFILFTCLVSCSSLGSKPTAREFKIERAWARHTLSPNYKGYRIQHRMPTVLYKHLVIQGNAIDGIRAYHSKTGRLVWSKAIKGGVEIGAIVAHDQLFFGANDGFFYSLNPLTGDVNWSFPLKAEGLGAPLVADDKIYFIAGNNIAYALHHKTGEQIWLYPRQEVTPLNIRGASEPTVSGSIVYMAFSDGALVALDKTRGSVLWERSLSQNPRFKDIDSKPVVDGDRLYVSTYDGELHCLNVKDGRTIWTYDEGSSFSVTIEGSTLYFSSSNGHVIALDKNSGKELWKISVDKTVTTQPRYYKGLLLMGQYSGDILVLDSRDGRHVASYPTGRGIASTPVIDSEKNRMYVISVDANLFVFNLGWKRIGERWDWEASR